MNDTNPHLKGLKVLVIDDSKTIRKTAETLLAKEGCEVFTAVDGFDVFAVYEAAGVVWAVVLFLVALIAQLLLVLRKRGAV